MQAELAASGLGENPVAPAENLALLGALEEGEAPKGPTMMGREARQLMLSGQGAAGLVAWKVGVSTLCTCTAHLANASITCLSTENRQNCPVHAWWSPDGCPVTKSQEHSASQVWCTMQERYYGEKLHLNTKDPASCRKVVEDFVQASFGCSLLHC